MTDNQIYSNRALSVNTVVRVWVTHSTVTFIVCIYIYNHPVTTYRDFDAASCSGVNCHRSTALTLAPC